MGLRLDCGRSSVRAGAHRAHQGPVVKQDFTSARLHEFTNDL